jgi:hypothetical protein
MRSAYGVSDSCSADALSRASWPMRSASRTASEFGTAAPHLSQRASGSSVVARQMRVGRRESRGRTFGRQRTRSTARLGALDRLALVGIWAGADGACALEVVRRAQRKLAERPWKRGVNVCGQDLCAGQLSAHAQITGTALACSPGAMSRSATRCMSGSCARGSSAARGKTTTAFGSQEWLISAMGGETATPSGVKEGAVNVSEFVVNCTSG